jgi:hypothetical protein
MQNAVNGGSNCNAALAGGTDEVEAAAASAVGCRGPIPVMRIMLPQPTLTALRHKGLIGMMRIHFRLPGSAKFLLSPKLGHSGKKTPHSDSHTVR